MVYIFNDHPSQVNLFVAELRDTIIQKDAMRFRKNIERIGTMMAYEISKTLAYKEIATETPLGIAHNRVPAHPPVLATILRAGLPMHHGMLQVFDAAPSAFVAAYRKHHKDGTFEIQVEYVSCPDLSGQTLIIADPMLATGASLVHAVKALQQYGTPSQIHICSAIASVEGLNYVRRMLPDAQIWLGALDQELTAKSYIVPGLGDAGDLSFGMKVQD